MNSSSADPKISKHAAQIVIAVVVAIVVVVIAFGVALPLVEQSLAEPRIGLTNERPGHDPGSCDNLFFPGPPQYFTLSFTLYNTGEADGLATVQFFLDDAAVLGVWSQYFVAAHLGVDGILTASVNDCTGSHSFAVRITSVVKA